MTTQHNSKEESKEKREESFDAHYQKLISAHKRLERINIASEIVKKHFEDYEETESFVDFIRSVEGVFASAEQERWSVERTQDEMIKSEIYLLAQQSGVAEEVFGAIYDEFKNASANIQKIQEIADRMLEKYAQNDIKHAKECTDFVLYVRDSLLVFAQVLSGNEKYDELAEAKEQIITLRMKTLSVNNKPPMEMLKQIYDEFLKALQD